MINAGGIVSLYTEVSERGLSVLVIRGIIVECDELGRVAFLVSVGSITSLGLTVERSLKIRLEFNVSDLRGIPREFVESTALVVFSPSVRGNGWRTSGLNPFFKSKLLLALMLLVVLLSLTVVVMVLKEELFGNESIEELGVVV